MVDNVTDSHGRSHWLAHLPPMPHKRAKRAVRERERSLKGTDLPPKHSGNEETVPKSVARILNAEKIRKDFKKRKIDEHDGIGNHPQLKRRRHASDVSSAKDEGLKIHHGETIAHFNKRVESSMMPVIRTAIQRSSAQVRRVQKHEIEEGIDKTIINTASRPDKVSNPPPPASNYTTQQKPLDKPKEFRVTSTSAPRRLNDIAQAPPQFRNLPRGAQSSKDCSKEKFSPREILSMAQKAMMEEERKSIIERYRELKTKKLHVSLSPVSPSTLTCV